MRRWFAAVLAVALLLAGFGGAFGHTGSVRGVDVGIEEKLGAFVPLDALFTGEDGRTVSLRELIRVPTMLSLLYYRCTNACDTVLVGEATAVRQLSGTPGKDYALLTVSIDERETPADALKAKRIALACIQKPFPAEAWRFLTGSAESIDRLSDAVGYRFHRNGDEFDHPLGLVMLSPSGKVTRYMIGAEFLPMDLSMSILESSAGRVGPTIAKMLRFCFSYDPRNRRFAFNTLKVSAVVILALVCGFGLYLVLTGKRRRAGKGVSR
jgi:protein SCO1/2